MIKRYRKRYVVFGLTIAAGLTILAIWHTNFLSIQHTSQQKVSQAFTVQETQVSDVKAAERRAEAAEQQLEMTKKQLDQAVAKHQTELARLASFSSSPSVLQHPDQKLEARMTELEAQFEVTL